MPDPEQGGRWGILGGTFDPVHVGHLSLAEQMRERKKLDGVLFIPAWRHPFKDECRASYADRVAMLKLALHGRNSFSVCEIEKEEHLPGHSLGTVRALRQRYSRATFHFIIGQDNLPEITRWHRPEQLMKEVTVLVGSRLCDENESSTGLSLDGVEMVATSLVPVSSTEIRRLLKEGSPREQLTRMMPKSVLDYIAQKGLYQ